MYAHRHPDCFDHDPSTGMARTEKTIAQEIPHALSELELAVVDAKPKSSGHGRQEAAESISLGEQVESCTEY